MMTDWKSCCDLRDYDPKLKAANAARKSFSDLAAIYKSYRGY
jgi:hypothetical protein